AIDNEPTIQPGPIREGGSQNQSQGTHEGTPTDVRLPVSVLPGEDRPGERTTVEQVDRGRGQADRSADGQKRQTPSPESRTGAVRAGTRPSTEPERPTTVRERQVTESPTGLPTLPTSNPTRRSTGAEDAVSVTAPRVKKGRPKKYA